MEVITYGGIVRRLVVPDCEGHRADVVLGFNNLDSYLAGHPYFGAITGRVAGRLSGASFQLEGTTYMLARNDPPNHLHGGIQGFDKKVWMAAPVESSRGASLRMLSQSFFKTYLVQKRTSEDSSNKLVRAARLAHLGSGRVLNVSTTEQYLQLYTASALDGTLVGKSGVPYVKYGGICLECEGYSDGPNAPSLGNIILRPGHPQCHTTAYAFSSGKSL